MLWVRQVVGSLARMLRRKEQVKPQACMTCKWPYPKPGESPRPGECSCYYDFALPQKMRTFCIRLDLKRNHWKYIGLAKLYAPIQDGFWECRWVGVQHSGSPVVDCSSVIDPRPGNMHIGLSAS